MLRDYQQKSIDMVWDWLFKNNGNVCVVMPTGSGKSHVIASLIKDAVKKYEGTRVLMLCHVKEIIEQNSQKMREHWPNAPMGIYSASLNKRCLSEQITFAGIQSIVRRAKMLGHIDLLVVDECHSIGHSDSGNYRNLINQLLEINPSMRVVGYSATPYRLGHGMIHEGDDVIFDALIEPIQIETLIAKGYLAPLRSKHTEFEIDVAGIKKRGGEFIAGDLERAVDTNDNNVASVKETIKRASDRKSWLVFCTGVAHAQHVSELFSSMGVTSACVTGDTPQQERADILQRFKAGEIRALTNMNVLTTGFDYPGIDCLVMLRPTMSPGLYLQMAGRGMRIAPEKDDCIVLDFAGNVKRHGPITAVEPPSKKGKGVAPTKTCPQCSEIILAALSACNACGFEFQKPEPEKEEKSYRLHDDDIMGFKPVEIRITKWKWNKHVSRTSGKEMLKVTYYGNLSDEPIAEYLAVMHDGYAGNKSRLKLAVLAHKAGVFIDNSVEPDLVEIANAMNETQPPKLIVYKREGKFFKVMHQEFNHVLQGTILGVAA